MTGNTSDLGYFHGLDYSGHSDGRLVCGQAGQCEQAARRQCITVLTEHTEGILLIRHEVKYGNHERPERLADVEEAFHGGRAEHCR